jgi:hypothetical protein
MIMKKALIMMCVFFPLASTGEGAYIANRDFLSVGQGARANSMGEAFAAVADDTSAIFWNPAGLTQLRSDEISTSYADRFDGLANEAQVHYARRGRTAMWGFAYAGSYVSDIPVTQSLTQTELDAIQTGSFAATDNPEKSVMDHALLFSYARPIRPDSLHSVGTTVKMIYRDFLGMVHGYGSAIDLGYHYTTASGGFRFGTNVQNLASVTSYMGTIDNLGVKATATESYIATIKSGIAYSPGWRVMNGKLLIAADVNMLSSFDVDSFNAGIEYAFGENIALRAGKIFGRQDDSSEDYSLGMGLRFSKIVVDFSFLSNELGETARGTLGYRLGSDYNAPGSY